MMNDGLISRARVSEIAHMVLHDNAPACMVCIELTTI